MRAMWVFVATAMVFASGCAQKDWIDRTLVTVDVNGVWTGSTTGLSGGSRVRLELVQEGAKVRGTINSSTSGVSGSYSGPVDGSVSGDAFTFTDGRGRVGEVTVAGDDMEGYLQGLTGKISVSWTIKWWRVRDSKRRTLQVTVI